MKKLFAIFLLFFVLGANIAHADEICGENMHMNDADNCAMCDMGYYLNKNNECEICYGGRYYCPGDDNRYECPDPTNIADTSVLPAEYTDAIISSIDQYTSGSSANPLKTIEKCISMEIYTHPRGKLKVRHYYTPDTEMYDNLYDYWWNNVNPGYYMHNLGTCYSNAMFKDASECPAGAYCPGESTRPCGDDKPENIGLYTCPDNTYSDGGASECTPCPPGYGNTGNDFESHIGADSCTIIECAPGQYLGDDGYTCTPCEIGYYCPGDNKIHECGGSTTPYYADEVGLAECKQCPEMAPEITSANGVIDYWYWIAAEDTPESKIHTKKSSCRARWYIKQTHGTLKIDCGYGNDGYHTDGHTCQLGINAQVCDAGYYIDETDKTLVRSRSNANLFIQSYPYTLAHEYCTPVPVGFYSMGNTWTATECPANTSTREPGATSADMCISLCQNGGTKLHAGEYAFNIWPNGNCSTPVLQIGLPDGTCCVNLESGSGRGINTIYKGQTYHTID